MGTLVDVYHLSLALLVVGSAVILVSLWYIMARLRHRRHLVCMSIKSPSTDPPLTIGGDKRGQMSRGNRRNYGGGENLTPYGTLRRQCERTGEEFTFFFKDTVLSQWHYCHFIVEGENYNTTEQFMMYQKAGEFILSCVIYFFIASQYHKLYRQSVTEKEKQRRKVLVHAC